MKRIRLALSLLLVILLLLPAVLSSCSNNHYEVVMEYNGIKLTEDKYNYWVSTFKRNILASYSDVRDTEEFWSQPYDETRTVEEYFTEIINERIMNYLIAQDIFKKNSLTLDTSVKNAIRDDVNEKIEYYGSRAALNAELAGIMLNVDSLKDIYTWEEKHEKVYDYLYGKGGIDEVSSARLSEYYRDNYSCIRYIVLYTTKIATDKDGNYVKDPTTGEYITEELSEEELAKKNADIEECFSKMQNGEDFETLRKEYSEFDTSNYPNGFFVSANEVDIWGADIILKTKDAKVGDVYKVEEETAVFLIEKLSLPDFGSIGDNDIKQLANLTKYATQEMYDLLFGELRKGVTLNSELLATYKLSAVKPNPYYSI